MSFSTDARRSWRFWSANGLASSTIGYASSFGPLTRTASRCISSMSATTRAASGSAPMASSYGSSRRTDACADGSPASTIRRSPRQSADSVKCIAETSFSCREYVGLELRSAVHRNTDSGNPSCAVGRDICDDVGNILGLADALQCLHAQRDLASRFCLRKIRHIRVDDTGCDGINAYGARAKDGGPVFDQRLNRSFGRGV